MGSHMGQHVSLPAESLNSNGDIDTPAVQPPEKLIPKSAKIR